MKYKVGMKLRNITEYAWRKGDIATITDIDREKCVHFRYTDGYNDWFPERFMYDKFEILDTKPKKPILTCKVEVPERPNKIENLFRAVSMLEVED